MNFQLNMEGLFIRILVTISILGTIGNCTEIDKDLSLSSNDKETIVVSSISSLDKMEAGRGDSNNFHLRKFQKNFDSPVNEKSDKEPIILGTSKVAIVYSEGKSSSSLSTSSDDKDKNAASNKQGMAPRVVYPSHHKEMSLPTMANDRNWRDVSSRVRDSYLDALEHSKTSKDPHEGIDIRTKNFFSKLTRRDNNSEGPVYRHPADDKYESASKEAASGITSSYSSSSLPSSAAHNDAADIINNRPMRKNIGRISYGGAEPSAVFLQTPSHSYSLPAAIQTFPDYQNNDFYAASPQISYPPSALPQTPIYTAPINNNNNNNNNYNSRPQSSDGVSETSYYGLPGNNRYPVGTPQQAYGGASSSSSSSVYGAPYATHHYSQHLPSLPSMDLIWPFALKLNAFTIAKILLKLVIFKMIVKFIGVICLLLFIPKLEIIKKVGNNDDDDSDDSRKFDKPGNLSLDYLITAFVTNSIQQYEKKNFSQTPKAADCTNFHCQMRKINNDQESWNDYARLFDNYVAEEGSNVGVVDANRDES